MANSKIYTDKRNACQDAYISGESDTRVLAATFGVSIATVRSWMKKGKWIQLARDEKSLDARVTTARKKAIVTALEEFARDPKNVALQSLVSLLRNEQKRSEPVKELNDYIVKFLDQVTDFYIEKGYPGLLKDFQSSLHDLSEYLRVRNG